MLRRLLLLGLIILLLSAAPASSEVTRDSALLAISEADSVIGQMQEDGFSVTYANDTLNEARLLLEQKYYEASEALARKVLDIRDSALRVSGLMDTVEARLYELTAKGYEVSDAKALFASGLSEFKLGNFDDAEKILDNAVSRLDEIESEEALKRAGAAGGVDVVALLLDYLWLIVIVFLAAFITGMKLRSASAARKRKSRITFLEREKAATENKLKEAQKKYFEKGAISKMEYDITLDRHSRKLAEIKKELSILKAKAR